MIRQLMIALGVIALGIAYEGIALATIQCPPAPEQTSRDYSADISGVITRFKRFLGVEAKAQAAGVAKDLLGKLPRADRVYVEQMMYATFCSALNEDKTLTDSERRKELREYHSDVRKAMEHQTSEGAKPPASVPPPSKQPSKEIGSGLKSNPVERVHFAITRFEQTYAPWPMVGEPLGFNIYFKNVGNGMAYDADFQPMAVLESDPSQYSQQRAIAEFEKWLQAQPKLRMSIPKDKELWESALGAIVTPEDVNNLLKGRKVMYLVGSIQFRDDFGKHTQRICHFLQPPLVTATGGHSELGIFQLCNQYNDEVAGWK